MFPTDATVPWTTRIPVFSGTITSAPPLRTNSTPIAAATAGGATLVAVAASPVVGVVGLGVAAYLAWDWFSYRVKNGMRF